MRIAAWTSITLFIRPQTGKAHHLWVQNVVDTMTAMCIVWYQIGIITLPIWRDQTWCKCIVVLRDSLSYTIIPLAWSYNDPCQIITLFGGIMWYSLPVGHLNNPQPFTVFAMIQANTARHQQCDLPQIIICNHHLTNNMRMWSKDPCWTNNLTTATENTHILGKLSYNS